MSNYYKQKVIDLFSMYNMKLPGIINNFMANLINENIKMKRKI